MTDVKDGGPAFPDPARGHSQGHPNDAADTSTVRTGVTMRDYFAAAALQGLCSGFNGGRGDADWFEQHGAKSAYRIAEAMLQERER